MRSLPSVLLLGAAVVSALLGCAMPLCALAASAAFLVPRRQAVPIVAAAWLLNQFLGFTVHGYPHTAQTYAWGVGIGAAAFASLWIASVMVRDRRDIATAGLGFLGAFAAFELTLVVASVFLGGWDAYAAPTVMQIFELNAVWFAGTTVVGVVVQRLRIPTSS